MSDAATYQRAVAWIEDDAARRHGMPVKAVRAMVARDMGLAPGTLENVRKGRTKGLRGWIERKIDEALVRALERRIAALSHELALAKARGVAGDRRAVGPLVAAREELAQLLAEVGRAPCP